MTNYPSAYIDYLVYFHGDRDYFECHEVLEEYWKEHPGDPLSGIYVGLIQVAVALYHQRRGNRNGAVKMLKQAIRGLHNPLVEQLGINGEQLQARLKQRLEELETSPESALHGFGPLFVGRRTDRAVQRGLPPGAGRLGDSQAIWETGIC